MVLVGSSVCWLTSPAVIGPPCRWMKPNACMSTTFSPSDRAMRSFVITDEAITSCTSSHDAFGDLRLA